MINNIQSTLLSILFLLIVHSLPAVVLAQEFKSLEISKNRVVLNKVLPPSPSNLDRTVKIPMSFTVLPDGTVGEVIPLSKGDPSLEAISIKTLKKWKFNPIEDETIMKGEITFTFSPEGGGDSYSSKESLSTKSDNKSKNTKYGTYYPVNFSAWGEFMNKYAVWVDNEVNSNQGNIKELTFSFSLSEDKVYDIEIAADNIATVIFDGDEVTKVSNYVGKEIFKLFLRKGNHKCSIKLFNYASSTSKWEDNPVGFAMVVSDNGKTIITTRDQVYVVKETGKYYPVSHPVWNDLLKNHAVWINNKENNHEGEYKDLTFETKIPKSGFYNFEISADDTAEFTLDGNKIMDISYQKGIHNFKIILEEGVHQLQMKVMNFTLYKSKWEENAVGAAILIKDNSGIVVFSTRDEKYCHKELSAIEGTSQVNNQSISEISLGQQNNELSNTISTIPNLTNLNNLIHKNITLEEDNTKIGKKNIKDNVTKNSKTVAMVHSNSDVKIGKQIWMTKNLDVAKFRNGDVIPEARTKDEWREAGEKQLPAWCYYDNNPEKGKIYGKLYNWYAVNDERGLAPIGYHIPSKNEWEKLVEFLVSDDPVMPEVIFKGKVIRNPLPQWNIKPLDHSGKKMKSKSVWEDYTVSYDKYFPGDNIVTVSGNGSNSSGFSGLPGGKRSPDYLFFHLIGTTGSWWSSTENITYMNHPQVRYPKYNAWSITMKTNESDVSIFDDNKNAGLSVRCIKD